MKFSIIIPIFQTEKYLPQCVEGVLGQTYHDAEIILVDDGSRDGSGIICDQYEASRPNIQVIHKENGGLSDARNAGLKAARGDYVIFLDSDDYWEHEDMLEKLAASLKRRPVDVLNFQYRFYDEDTDQYRDAFGKVSVSDFEQINNKANQFEYLMREGQYIASACNKVIRRNLFDRYDLWFRKGVFSEDVEWCARLAIAAESFGLIEEDGYIYRQRASSISHSLTLKNLVDLRNGIVKCYSYGRNKKDPFAKAYLNYAAYQYAVFFVSAGYVRDLRKIKIYKNLKKYAGLLRYNASPKVDKMREVYRLGGYPALCLAGSLYARIRK